MANPVKPGGEYSPEPKWNSTVPQQSAGDGDVDSYPDAHSTVPTPSAGSGSYPYPDAHSSVSSGAAGAGSYPVPEDRSTVAAQSAGAGAGGPREEYPADRASPAGQSYDGGDGGDYRYGVPYTQDMPPTQKWSMFPNDGGGYGHSDDVRNVDLHKGDWGTPVGMEVKGYEVLEQGRDSAPPATPGGEQYPEPESDPWDAEPQNFVKR